MVLQKDVVQSLKLENRVSSQSSVTSQSLHKDLLQSLIQNVVTRRGYTVTRRQHNACPSTNGQADLCHLTEKFESTYSEADKTAAAANGTELNLLGYIGLYGGTSCAHYTIETERLVNTTCSIETTGTCRRAN